jgi:aconitate hydratase
VPTTLRVVATPTDASAPGAKPVAFDGIVRIDTPAEADYYRNGGILQYVLRSLL